MVCNMVSEFVYVSDRNHVKTLLLQNNEFLIITNLRNKFHIVISNYINPSLICLKQKKRNINVFWKLFSWDCCQEFYVNSIGCIQALVQRQAKIKIGIIETKTGHDLPQCIAQNNETGWGNPRAVTEGTHKGTKITKDLNRTNQTPVTVSK